MRCKPNELCLVLDLPLYPTEATRLLPYSIVETIEYVGRWQNDEVYISETWKCKSSLAPDGIAFIADRFLRPIRPPEEPVQVGQLEGLTERA